MFASKLRYGSALVLPVFVALLGCSDHSLTGVSDDLHPQFAPGTQGTPTVTTIRSTSGVTSDGADYVGLVGGVKSYIAVSGDNSVLSTYNTGRKATMTSSSPAWVSLTGGTHTAEVNFYGINAWGKYQSMAVGSSTYVHGDLEFYVGKVGYQLKYRSLGVVRVSASEWIISDDCAALFNGAGCWSGFAPSGNAELAVLRRKAQESLGQVSMPMTLRVVLK